MGGRSGSDSTTLGRRVPRLESAMSPCRSPRVRALSRGLGRKMEAAAAAAAEAKAKERAAAWFCRRRSPRACGERSRRRTHRAATALSSRPRCSWLSWWVADPNAFDPSLGPSAAAEPGKQAFTGLGRRIVETVRNRPEPRLRCCRLIPRPRAKLLRVCRAHAPRAERRSGTA